MGSNKITSDHLLQELVVQCASVYRGYVSDLGHTGRNSVAHVLFSLPEECVAAAITLSMTAAALASNIQAITELKLPFLPCKTLETTQARLPLNLQIGITSGNVDVYHSSTTTARMVRSFQSGSAVYIQQKYTNDERLLAKEELKPQRLYHNTSIEFKGKHRVPERQ